MKEGKGKEERGNDMPEDKEGKENKILRKSP